MSNMEAREEVMSLKRIKQSWLLLLHFRFRSFIYGEANSLLATKKHNYMLHSLDGLAPMAFLTSS